MYGSLAFQINTLNGFQIYIFKSAYFILHRLSEAETVSLVRKPTSSHLQHLFCEHAKAFPGWLGCIVPPVRQRSATRSPPGWLCLKHHAREARRTHVLQPPHAQASLNREAQRLSSTLADQPSHPIWEPDHAEKKDNSFQNIRKPLRLNFLCLVSSANKNMHH